MLVRLSTMCWNWEVSLITGLLSVTVGVYTYRRNKDGDFDRWIAILATAVGSMQFLEMIMWLDQSCTGWNQGASFTAFMLLTWVHPWVSVYLAFKYWYKSDETNKRLDDPKTRKAMLYQLYFFDFCMFLTLVWSVTRTAVYVPTTDDLLCSRPEITHLAWDWDRHLVKGGYVQFYGIFTFGPVFCQGWNRGLFWALWATTIGLLATYAQSGGGEGSMYCWLGSLSAVWQLLYVPRWIAS